MLSDALASEASDVGLHAGNRALAELARAANVAAPEIRDLTAAVALARVWSAAEAYHRMLLRSNPARAEIFEQVREAMLKNDEGHIDPFLKEHG